MGAAWITLLQNLDFPDHEIGIIIHKLHKFHAVGKCGLEGIQSFFNDCLATGGKPVLTSTLKHLLHEGEEATLQKKVRVQIFSTHAEGEELVLRPTWHHLTPLIFKTGVLPKGHLVLFKEGQVVEDAPAVWEFGKLVKGESYLLDDFGGVYENIKTLENFNHREMRACEDELAHNMMAELKAHGFAMHPVDCPDLRLHCAGAKDEQEFDALILDEGDKVFIGSSKHAAHSTREVQQVLDQGHTLLQRNKDVQKYPSYACFQGRTLGSCLRVDHIDQTKQHAIDHLCFRKGVGLFQKSGSSLTLRTLSFIDHQSINRGFIVTWLCEG